MTTLAPTDWQAPSGPSGPAHGLRYAGFWIRTLAYVIDTLTLTALGFAISFATGLSFATVTMQEIRSATSLSVSFVASPTLPAILMYLAYFAGLWALRGQTIGMALFGLRVLRAADGSRIGPGRALGRLAGLLLSFFVVLIGVIWVAADSRKQGWHDKLARTVVVRPAPAPILPATAGP